MTYSVTTLRAAGLEAKWFKVGKYKSTPCLFARDPKASHPHQRDTWWQVGTSMWSAMCRDGIVTGFRNSTHLGDVFSI